jgi:hypothetical protein
MKFKKQQLRAIDRELRRPPLALQPTGFQASYPDNPHYLENQWAEDALVAFENEGHGEGLAGMLDHLAKWCDANGLPSETLRKSAALYREG